MMVTRPGSPRPVHNSSSHHSWRVKTGLSRRETYLGRTLLRRKYPAEQRQLRSAMWPDRLDFSGSLFCIGLVSVWSLYAHHVRRRRIWLFVRQSSRIDQGRLPIFYKSTVRKSRGMPPPKKTVFGYAEHAISSTLGRNGASSTVFQVFYPSCTTACECR
jgi:hypothetical protein